MGMHAVTLDTEVKNVFFSLFLMIRRPPRSTPDGRDPHVGGSTTGYLLVPLDVMLGGRGKRFRSDDGDRGAVRRVSPAGAAALAPGGFPRTRPRGRSDEALAPFGRRGVGAKAPSRTDAAERPP